MNCLLCKTTRVEATELFSRKYLGKQQTIRLAIVLLDNIYLYSHHLRSALQALNCWFSHMLYVKDNRACFSTVKYYYDAFANSYVRTTLYRHLGRRGLESPLASTIFVYSPHWYIRPIYIYQIKSNQITFIVTSPQHKCLGEWNSYERAPDSAKKQTTIYIWTYLQIVQKTMCKIHIHTVYSVHTVYYKDILIYIQYIYIYIYIYITMYVCSLIYCIYTVYVCKMVHVWMHTCIDILTE